MATVAATKRRSTRQAATRKATRSVYYDGSSDDDDDVNRETDDGDFESRTESAPLRAQKRHRTSTRTRRSTRADSRSEAGQDDDEDAEEESSFAQRRSQVKRQRAAPRTRHSTRSKSEAKAKAKAVVKPALKGIGRRRRWNTIAETPKREFTGPSDGHIPAWTTLPLEILRDIFIYASNPLHEQSRTAAANMDWLMKSAHTCRAFALPALEAYYRSPALLNSLHPHHLLQLLQMPREMRYTDYSVKIKTIAMDVRHLAYTAHGRPHFDLSALVAEVPQLQHLEILHPVDEPPFRPMKVQPWHYPPALFQNLQAYNRRLKGFRWNRDMIDADSTELYGWMAQIHSSKPFEYLERLTVCDFQHNNDSGEPPPSEEGNSGIAPGLATSISLLPSLKDLTFTSCDVVMDQFLERLPKNLERLEITNCLELTSGMLRKYLATAGSQLRELVLNHNTSLNLAFFPGLQKMCPNLEVLKMDLRYYSERVNFFDADPLYDQLLAADEVPTWPPTLRHLELVQLQRCSAEASQNLFRSLVDSSQDLPDLRYLVLQAHINIPWRDRAGFRDQWIERLRRVYLRTMEPPNPHFGSLRQFRHWQLISAEESGSPDPLNATIEEVDSGTDNVSHRRKVAHIALSPAKAHVGDTDVYSDSSPDHSANQPKLIRRSKRVATSAARAVSVASQSVSPEVDSDSEPDESTDWRKRAERYVQGLCRVVDIRIDNQRPRENQFTEGDFLDSEMSGDEDWHSGAEMEFMQEGYAW